MLHRLSLVPINSHIGCRIYTQSDDDAFEGVVRRPATRGRLIFSFSFVSYVHGLLFEYSPLRYLRRNLLYSGNSLILLFLPRLNPRIPRIRQIFLSLLTIFQKERSISQDSWINCDRILRNDNLHISFSGNVPWNNPIPRTTKRREDEGAAASTNRSRARAPDFPLEIIPLVHKESFSARCSGQIAPLLHRLIAFTRGKVRLDENPPSATTMHRWSFTSGPLLQCVLSVATCYVSLVFDHVDDERWTDRTGSSNICRHEANFPTGTLHWTRYVDSILESTGLWCFSNRPPMSP